MALADHPATPATQTHRAARSDTLASRSLLSAAHHRFPCASSVVPVSACGSASPHAGAGEVHRQCFASVSQLTNCTTLRRATASAPGHQRGHARNVALCLSCAARCGATYQASPLCFDRRSVGLASARGSASPRAVCTPRLACASCWISRSLRLGLAAVVFVAVVAHARYGHPLRFYIRPYCVKCAPVVPLKLRLVSPTASRPHGFPKQVLCKVAFAGGGRPAVGASRSVPALRAAVRPPLWLS